MLRNRSFLQPTFDVHQRQAIARSEVLPVRLFKEAILAQLLGEEVDPLLLTTRTTNHIILPLQGHPRPIHHTSSSLPRGPNNRSINTRTVLKHLV